MSKFKTLVENSLRLLEWPLLLERLTQLAATDLGRELAEHLLPLPSLDEAKQSLQETAALLRQFSDAGLELPFRDIFDLRPHLAHIEKGGFLEEERLYEFFLTLKHCNLIISTLQASCPTEASLMAYCKRFQRLDSLLSMLQQLFDLRGKISDDASDSLRKTRRGIKQLSDRIHHNLQELLQKTFGEEYFQDDFITIREDRLVLPMKANMKGKVRGIIHGSSNTGHTYFIEPEEVVQANNDLKVALREEREEINRILKQASDEASKHRRAIVADLELIAELDLLNAKAKLAGAMHASLPSLKKMPGPISLRQAKHPLLVLQGDLVVANDICFEADTYCLVISGPNAGGKTVALKTLGLNLLMAMSGLLPTVAESSELGYFDSILVDLGDQQSLATGLSTFSAHLTNIAGIIEEASECSLVLLDEIASNTGAVEGSALACAILEHLAQERIRTAASTHYPDLKNLAMNEKYFSNASVTLDPKTSRPTYRLTHGVAGESNALGIAAQSGLKEQVVKRATELLGPEQQERLNLQKERQLWEERHAELEKQAKSLEQEQLTLEAAKQTLAKQQREKILDEYQTVAKALAEARQRLRELSKSIRPEKALAFDRTLTSIKTESDKALKTLPTDQGSLAPQTPIEVGSKVRLLISDQTAEVLRAPDRRGMLELQVGALRMMVHRDEVRAASTQTKKSASAETPSNSQ